MTPTCVTTTSATTTRSLLPTRPETGRGRPPTTHQSHQSKERRLTPSASRRIGTGEHRQALTGGPYLSIEVGHTGLMLLWSVKVGKWVGLLQSQQLAE